MLGFLRALSARLFTTGGLRCANPPYALLLAFCLSSAHAAPEPVSIPPAGLSSSPAPLRAFLFQPETPGPHPAVVMLHGCGGPYARNGGLNPRDQMWADLLATQGYAALIVDSFSSRGLKELCTQKYADRTLRISERRGDAYAALAWLHTRTDIDHGRVGVIGWSNGASTTLDVISHKPETGSGFRAAVSLYPGCSARARKPDAFQPYAPLLVLIGEADDWTPAAPCVSLAKAVSARGIAMQSIIYPDSYHDFDNPALTQKRVRKDVPNGVNPGQGTTTAPNPEAREDAKRHVIEFFAGQLK